MQARPERSHVRAGLAAPPSVGSKVTHHATLRFRGDVEGLRAVAVLLVVLDHLQAPGFHGGFFGVDVFFVISGYLITSLLAAEYAKRAEAHGGRRDIGRPS
jgi:peptidoglycan/LPS O-acetylase OafA/YrhL